MADQMAKDVAKSVRMPTLSAPLMGAQAVQGLRSGLAGLLNFVVPPSCPVCRTMVQTDGGLCASCWKKVPWIEEPVCNRLGLPLAYDLGPGAVSAEALANPPYFDRLRAACAYDGVAPRLIHALKFANQRYLAESLGAMMARAGRALLDEDNVILVPVPLHPWRRMQRRYNQSALLAGAISALTGAPVVYDAVRRVKRTRQQVALSRGERLRNLQGAFSITPKGQAELADRSIVLIDDVHSTGATLNALSQTITAMPGSVRVRRVDALVFSLNIAAGDPVTI
ncbi:MAG: ComF family protein [Pseudomonadota bacterium]